MANYLNRVMNCGCALFCNSLNWWWWVECLTGLIVGLALPRLPSETGSVWSINLCGPTSMEVQLKTAPKTCNSYTKKVQHQALSSCSGYRFGDEWLHWDLQECSRSQELRLHWKQLIPSGLEYIPSVPHHQACPASRTSEIWNGNLFIYSDKHSSAAWGTLGAFE